MNPEGGGSEPGTSLGNSQVAIDFLRNTGTDHYFSRRVDTGLSVKYLDDSKKVVRIYPPTRQNFLDPHM